VGRHSERLSFTFSFTFLYQHLHSAGICICIRISMDTTAFSFLLSVEFSTLGFLANRFWYTMDMTSWVGVLSTKLLVFEPVECER
jgi:hypothetical protein